MARARSVSGLHPEATLLENTRAIVAVRVAEMFSFAHAIGRPEEDEDLHNMRIAAKRLRYTLEMFRVCLGPDSAALIDTVKEIQERIGAIHDADVLEAMARGRLAIAAHRHMEALVAAAGGEDAERVPTGGAGEEGGATSGARSMEDERVAAVRVIADSDPMRGLAVLLARTRAGRERDVAALTAWWAEQGGDTLRARLDSCLLDTAHMPASAE